jgi:hypothetical protein
MSPRLRTAAAAFMCTGACVVAYYAGTRYLIGAGGPALRLVNANEAAARVSTSEPSAAGELSRLVEDVSDYRQQQRLYIYAESLAGADIPAALNEGLYLPLSQRNTALEVLLGRWSEIDPEAATKYAAELPKSADPLRLHDRALAAWGGKDFGAALAWSLKQEKDDRNRCLGELAGVIAKSDPARAMEFAEKHFKGPDRYWGYTRLFPAWAERDFEAAFAAAQSINSPVRLQALSSVLNAHLEKDPRRVLQAMAELKNWDLSNTMLQLALETWTKRDAAAAQNWALSQPPGNLRAAALHQCAYSAAKLDPEVALAWALDKLEGKEQENGIRWAFWAMAERDLDAALARARGVVDEQTREAALGVIVSELARTEPQLALKTLNDLPEGSATRRDCLRTICIYWSNTDPPAAAQWIVENTTQSEYPYMLTQIVQDWERSDPSAAISWAESLPPGARKAEAVSQLLYTLVRNDPATASARFEAMDTETQRGAGERLAQGWAYNDAKASIEWASGLADDEARAKAIKGVISIWGFQEAPAAAKWIDSLPAGLDRDAAAQSFAVSTVSKDPQGSVAWALTIGDEVIRQSALRQVVSSWIERDKSAAATWLASDTSIPPDLKAELQQSAGGAR